MVCMLASDMLVSGAGASDARAVVASMRGVVVAGDCRKASGCRGCVRAKSASNAFHSYQFLPWSGV